MSRNDFSMEALLTEYMDDLITEDIATQIARLLVTEHYAHLIDSSPIFEAEETETEWVLRSEPEQIEENSHSKLWRVVISKKDGRIMALVRDIG